MPDWPTDALNPQRLERLCADPASDSGVEAAVRLVPTDAGSGSGGDGDAGQSDGAGVSHAYASTALWQALVSLGASVSPAAGGMLAAALDFGPVARAAGAQFVRSQALVVHVAPLDPAAAASAGSPQDTGPCILWLPARLLSEAGREDLVAALGDAADTDLDDRTVVCATSPIACVALDSLVLEAVDASSWDASQSDPGSVSAALSSTGQIVRMGGVVDIAVPGVAGHLHFRSISSEPVKQGIVSKATAIMIVKMPEPHATLETEPTVASGFEVLKDDLNYDEGTQALLFDAGIDPAGQLILSSIKIASAVIRPRAPVGDINSRAVSAPLHFLTEAGLCSGDWIWLSHGNGHKQLVCVEAWTDSGNAAITGQALQLCASPLVIRNLVRDATWQDCLEGVEVRAPIEPVDPAALPCATQLTLARVATPTTSDRALFEASLTAMERFFSTDRRIVAKGDWICVQVDGVAARIRSKIRTQHADLSRDLSFLESTASEFCLFEVADVRGNTSTNGPFLVDIKSTKVVQAGVVNSRVHLSLLAGMEMGPRMPSLLNRASRIHPSFGELVDICDAYLNATELQAFPCSILVHGATGVGKRALIRSVAAHLGLHIVEFNCVDLTREPLTKSLAYMQIWTEKAIDCSPSLMVLRNIDAACQGLGGPQTSAPSDPVEFRDGLERILSELSKAGVRSGNPVLLVATTTDVEKVPASVKRMFRYDMKFEVPSQEQREALAQAMLQNTPMALDVQVDQIAVQTAGLSARNLKNVFASAGIETAGRLIDSLTRSKSPSSATVHDLVRAGVCISSRDISKALGVARAAHSDMIGAPKIPNVQWEDIGGLAHVKDAILETIKLPLEHPELFDSGVKKRSGILLYGPPGTGKTLVAKAVATTLSLNFFSVKGPELLNMYIGESEANVRRVFQRARDARPCVVFFDELDSVAPKRGEKGDSGGVMDRIVSQLLAELDGMSDSGGSDVFVIAATNRPDLLDPALLRPGRFDELLYLGIASDRTAQIKVLEALTRKFNLAPDADLRAVADMCGYNYTGADFYALCSDALLKAMTRTIDAVNERLAELNAQGPMQGHPYPLTPQYYLDQMATEEEINVRVQLSDFAAAVRELVPSVPVDELQRYERLRDQFQKQDKLEASKGGEPNAAAAKRRAKGKQKAGN